MTSSSSLRVLIQYAGNRRNDPKHGDARPALRVARMKDLGAVDHAFVLHNGDETSRAQAEFLVSAVTNPCAVERERSPGDVSFEESSVRRWPPRSSALVKNGPGRAVTRSVAVAEAQRNRTSRPALERRDHRF